MNIRIVGAFLTIVSVVVLFSDFIFKDMSKTLFCLSSPVGFVLLILGIGFMITDGLKTTKDL